jgi:hypothetical protein
MACLPPSHNCRKKIEHSVWTTYYYLPHNLMIFGTLQTNNLSQTSSQPRFVVFNKGLLKRGAPTSSLIIGHELLKGLGNFLHQINDWLQKKSHIPAQGARVVLIPQTTVGSRTGGFLWGAVHAMNLGTSSPGINTCIVYICKNVQLHLNKTTNDDNNNNSFSKPQITYNCWVFESRMTKNCEWRLNSHWVSVTTS